MFYGACPLSFWISGLIPLGPGFLPDCSLLMVFCVSVVVRHPSRARMKGCRGLLRDIGNHLFLDIRFLVQQLAEVCCPAILKYVHCRSAVCHQLHRWESYSLMLAYSLSMDVPLNSITFATHLAGILFLSDPYLRLASKSFVLIMLFL